MRPADPVRAVGVIGAGARSGSSPGGRTVNLGMTPLTTERPYIRRVRMRAVRTSDQLVDLGLAAVLAALGLAEVLAPFSSRQGHGSALITCAGVVVLDAALSQRRRAPVAVAVVGVLLWPLLDLTGPTYLLFYGQFLPLALVLFSVVRYAEAPWAAIGGAGMFLPLVWVDVTRPEMHQPSEIAFNVGVFLVVALAAATLRRLAARAQESQRRAIAAEVAAAEQAMAAVVEERTRIARELHDIVAHSMTVMVVQAGAAEQVVHDDPTTVTQALRTIRSTGTDALAEMRRLVEMLRDSDEPGDLAPQPGLAAVESLVAAARRPGLAVRLEVTGEPASLPAGLDLAAYRIVQEALTNVRKHADASEVVVMLHYGDDEVRVDVRDNGNGGGDPVRTGGHGLVGMRERAALYGGSLEAGRTPSGFHVLAVLPLAGAVT